MKYYIYVKDSYVCTITGDQINKFREKWGVRILREENGVGFTTLYLH